MHDVAEFVEESDDVAMLQERRPSTSACWEVGEHAIDRRLAIPSLEEVKNGCVVVLSIPWVNIEVEVPN